MKKISAGGSPRGPKPGQKRTRTTTSATASVRRNVASSPPERFPVPELPEEQDRAVAAIAPGWELQEEARTLWDQLIPVLTDVGTATRIDAVPLASLVSGLALEKLCADHLLTGGVQAICETGTRGNTYLSPVISAYLGLRKSNQAAMAEAGLTRIRRTAATSEDRLLEALESERETTVSERLRLRIATSKPGGGGTADQ